MGMFTLISIVNCGLYAFFIITNIPILQGEEQPQCPSLTENPICPCYNFKEGLFLECPSATPNVVKNVLTKIKGTIQSLSIYDLDSSITDLRSDFLPPHVKIINLQISQSKISEINPNAFTSIRDSLKSLSILSSKLQRIPQDSFSQLQNIEILDLQLNDIKDIDTNTFQGLRLSKINLKGNKIENISENAFHYLEETLTELDITENFLNVFPLKSLANLTKLNSLRLAWNKIQSIPDSSNIAIQELLSVDLSFNEFTRIERNWLSCMPYVKTLTIFSNQIEHIDEEAFYSLNNLEHSLGLKEIDLSHNFFKHVPSNGLSETVLPALTTLNMSFNSLEQLMLSHPVKQFPLLEELIITKTNLTIITSKDFENFPSLKKLILKSNCLIRLSPGAFSKLHNLEMLDMSENKLENVPRERLQGLYSTRVLNISQNIIRELEEFTGDLQSLQKLDLSFNHITRISKSIFRYLYSLAELNLSGNWLSFIATDTFRMLHKIVHIDLSKNYFEVINTKLLVSIEAQVKSIAYDENPLTCNCESQELWRWMQNHYKIVLKGSSNLRCEHPEELHGYSFMELTSQKLCDVPVVIRIAIQDIQTYSVIVSWQSRNQSGLSGYQVAYYKEQMPGVIRGKILNTTARMTRLNHLTPGARYTICVIATGNFGASAGSSLPDARIATSSENNSAQLYGDEHLFNHLRGYMNDSQTSKCTSVNTIEIFGTSLDSPFSNTYMGIADILTRRLSLVVGCCIGFIVFIVLVSALGYMKTKKRPVATKTEIQQAPQYISYDNFPVPNIEAQTTDMDINTLADIKP
ncbi:unnamed protein product [Colias eurytheme]|nr:unnamed protein product [Colias eurytheme]